MRERSEGSALALPGYFLQEEYEAGSPAWRASSLVSAGGHAHEREDDDRADRGDHGDQKQAPRGEDAETQGGEDEGGRHGGDHAHHQIKRHVAARDLAGQESGGEADRDQENKRERADCVEETFHRRPSFLGLCVPVETSPGRAGSAWFER